jgi:hypothetical protein
MCLLFFAIVKRDILGIAGFHGGRRYYYKRHAQGLTVSPAIFQAKIDDILSEIPTP